MKLKSFARIKIFIIQFVRLFLFSTVKIKKTIKEQFQEFCLTLLALVLILTSATTSLRIMSLGTSITIVKKNAFRLISTS